MGNSDIHGLIDWQFDVAKGGHRPVTLVFAREKNEEALKEALKKGRTVVWFDNTLVGKEEYLVPLLENSLTVTRGDLSLVQPITLKNHSDADLILENQSDFTFQNYAAIITLKAHEAVWIQVKTIQPLPSFELKFKVLNAFTSPGNHPEISVLVGP
jgi:hypothetical protein